MTVLRTQTTSVTNPPVGNHITAVAHCDVGERVISGGFHLRTQRSFDLKELGVVQSTAVLGSPPGWLVDVNVQQTVQGLATVEASVLCLVE